MSTPGTEKKENKASFYDEFFERDKKGTLLLLLLVMTSLVLFRSYYDKNLHDSVHCASCHMSGEMYSSWQAEKGRYDCLGCHNVSLLDENRYLIAYMSKGSNHTLMCKQGVPEHEVPVFAEKDGMHLARVKQHGHNVKTF